METTLNDLRVLMIDDDETDAFLVERSLRKVPGYRINFSHAIDCQSARLAWKDHPFDAILLDFNLSGTDGFRVIQALNDDRIDAPIVLLTGQSEPSIAVEAMKRGVQDYLVKGKCAGERMISSLEAAIRKHELRREAELMKQQFSDLTSFIPDVFWISEMDKGITYASDAIEDVFGITPQEVLGSEGIWGELIHPDDRESTREIYRSVGEENQLRLEYRIERQDGETRWISERVRCIPKPKSKGGMQILGIARDITKDKHNEEQMNNYAQALQQAVGCLEETKGELEAANVAKSDFLANMSHEIRTPMTAILGFTEELIDEPQDPDTVQELAGIIGRNGRYLLELINDILDVSKIEAGQLDLEFVRCDIEALFQDIEILFAPRAKAKGLDLKWEFENPVPNRGLSDPVRLKQILVNLISNAIKFTSEGEIVVSAQFVEDDQSLRIGVRDSGIGIPQSKLDAIFQPFSQADSSTTRRFGGTGLGLTISRRISELMGGELGVSSEEGVGSTFWFQIPWETEEGSPRIEKLSKSSAAKHKSRTTTSTELKGFEILLAEDNPTNQHLIRKVLTKMGAKVDVANHGKEAVDLATKRLESHPPYDAVLMDMQMPVMDGVEATQTLRIQGYEGAIIALTAAITIRDKEILEGAGCDTICGKPIDWPQLTETIKEQRAARG